MGMCICVLFHMECNLEEETLVNTVFWRMLIELADVLNVEVSNLLGKKIEVKESEEQVDVVAVELAKLNELLVVYGEKLSSTKKKIKNGIAVIIFIMVFFAIYESWNEMFYEFGKNLYHVING